MSGKALIDPVWNAMVEWHTVTNSDVLGSLIRAKHPGDRATVTIVEANGHRRTVSVTLGVRPVPIP